MEAAADVAEEDVEAEDVDVRDEDGCKAEEVAGVDKDGAEEGEEMGVLVVLETDATGVSGVTSVSEAVAMKEGGQRWGE